MKVAIALCASILFSFIELAKSFQIPPGAQMFNSTPDENYTQTEEYKIMKALKEKEGNWSESKVEKKTNLWNFNDSNLEEFVENFEYVFVEFYARKKLH